MVSYAELEPRHREHCERQRARLGIGAFDMLGVPLAASGLDHRSSPVLVFILACALISLAATAILKDGTNQGISTIAGAR